MTPPDQLGAAAAFDDAARVRLSSAALRSGFLIIAKWRIHDPQARALFGGISRRTYRAWRKQPPRTLDAATLMRLSYLLGVFDALNCLYGQQLADEWVSLPNGNPIFAGRTPLAYMIAGGIPALWATRRLLDARRGGA